MRSFWDKDNRRWVPEAEWKGASAPSAPSGPMIIKDIEPYRSPVDRSVIGSRTQHRDHLKRHRLVELGNEKVKPRPRPMPALGPDLRRAYEQVSRGRK
jgi:hypothetical protein